MYNGIKIFGYGSLINERSLRTTVPEAENLLPCWLSNHVRSFETISTTRYDEDGVTPITALNVKPDVHHHVNGVCFEVPQHYFDALLSREGGYRLNQVQVQGYFTNQVYQAYMFVDNQQKKQSYLYDSVGQKHYLDICLKGAKCVSEDFYQMFIQSTYIGNRRLDRYLAHDIESCA